jgi:hypothetical protein
MLKTMMHVLEALDGGGAPSGFSLQIHVRSSEQHAAYLGTLSSLLGQGVDFRREADNAVYRWHSWRQGELLIVLHEPHSEAAA